MLAVTPNATSSHVHPHLIRFNMEVPVATQGVVPRTAFLEFGSTTIKFYLVSAGGENAGAVEREIKIPWDLGYDVFRHARISPSTVARCTSILRDLKRQFPEIAFDTVTAVGTAALREAQNAEVFQRVVWEEVGLKIHIIEGGIEAFLLETGFRSSIDAFPTTLFDLGGGSLEVVEFLSPFTTRKSSLPLGAIRLHCQIRHTKDLLAYVREGRQVAAGVLREHLDLHAFRDRVLIGTGGTVRTIVQLCGQEEFVVDDVLGLIDREVRGAAWTEVSPHRRKVLLPGLLVVESLLTVCRARSILYRTASVKRGLIQLTNLIPGDGGC